ncbi:MAG: outer membrane beta-barrel protein [Gemmataceae bacterium]|nr:outer membrane beta-barrel protein [Gemmataceae bacterium]MDW8265734.1 outer membrane beta-barrel protein [Gemmataceae bacterium]
MLECLLLSGVLVVGQVVEAAEALDQRPPAVGVPLAPKASGPVRPGGLPAPGWTESPAAETGLAAGTACPSTPSPELVPAAVPATATGAESATAEEVPFALAALFQQDKPTPPESAVRVEAALLTTEAAAEAEAEAAATAPPPDRFALMKILQGTWLGALMYDTRITCSGWIEQSVNGSTASISNQPVVWTDRANKYLLQQAWFHLERSLVTSGTTEPSWGFRIDCLYGTDYRFTLMRGFLNAQLENADGNQNLYGVDLPQFYVNCYIPTICQGLELRLGRIYTPFGTESIEAINTPLMSRSYAFNWCPPFTHMGLMGILTINSQWAITLMAANGNDIFFDHAQRPRIVGKIAYVTPHGKDAVTLGWSLGAGIFGAQYPYEPTTIALPWEPAGRNNINVVDFVWTHVFNRTWTYNFECIYGYQSSVPANVPGGIIKENAVSGTAHWGSIVNYLFCNITPWATGVLRIEFFDDFQGQRTGYEGLYGAWTLGVTLKPFRQPSGTGTVMIRPEVRYDHNWQSPAFEGKHGLFTGGADLIVRW